MVAHWSNTDHCSGFPLRPEDLTELNEEHPSGGHGALGVGGHALEVAGVGGVQVADAKARAVRGGAVGHPPGLLHHRGVVLQPAHHRGWVSRHPAEQLGRVAERRGDVVHGRLQADEVGTFDGKERERERREREGGQGGFSDERRENVF